jgi:hypothetical protein
VTYEHFDVYLEPMVEELLQLWDGVPAVDITQEVGFRSFTLRAMLLWTIHDFPGYETVGGFAHQGFATCPPYGEHMGAEHSIELGKQTYEGCCKWLPPSHVFRSEALKDRFNGTTETREKPPRVQVQE